MLLGKIVAYLVKLGADLCVCVATVHLTSENVPALGGSSWLSVGKHVSVGTSLLLDLSDHLQLVWVVDNELPGLTLVVGCSRNDLALRCNGRNLVVVFLYRSQINLRARVDFRIDL